ncbi:cell division cycle-associated protein 3-like [Saccostrea echinata]|uniref:cell division cycle-associated protein 3-like n=1 Tax=Saccostrea echinata TaxID=191078 RepID=UPI002A8397CD|nr:cell division cycle-associated protein 3-like [Saccostrea echinata]XP_061198368.1 cell division cycle-associated protein 3-like [Saccostrea echinata]
MGLSGSKDESEDFNTPPKIGTHRRIIDQEFDPRSPSVGIARTPIVVDKTPEGLLDPRSPTTGITRTPITTVTSKHAGVTETHDLAPLILHDEADIRKSLEEMEDTDKLLMDLEEIPDLDKLEITDLLEKQKKTTKSLTSTTLKDIPPHKLPASKDKNKIFEDAPSRVSKGSAKVPQPKQLFPSKRMAPGNKDNTRSPLATRTLDMNSPRKIVQQKQSKNIESQKAKSCALEAVTMSMNKENVNM